MTKHTDIHREGITDTQHGFTKDKPYLTGLTFYNEVNVQMDKGWAMDVTHLDFYKGFDTAIHNIVVSKLEQYGFQRWTTQLIRNWLDGHVQRIAVKKKKINVQMEISYNWCAQGGILGQGLFIFVNYTDRRVQNIPQQACR